MSSSTSISARGKNVTKDQKDKLVGIMESNIDLANDRFEGIDGKNMKSAKWKSIATELNALGGAQKDGDRWRRAWIDMKKYARSSATTIKEYHNRTGLGTTSKNPPKLSSNDQKILNIISVEVVEGTLNLEGGFSAEVQEDIGATTSVSASNAPITKPSSYSISREHADIAENFLSASVAAPASTIRSRGSAYTRDQILIASNTIEKNKVTALNRIATAMEERNRLLKEYLNQKKQTAIELGPIMEHTPIEHVPMQLEQAYEEEDYLEVEELLEDE